MTSLTIIVTYFAFLLGFGVIIANILKKHNIPDTLFLILFGLLVGPTLFSIPQVAELINLPAGAIVDVTQMGNIPDFLRVLALILMVFTGCFNLKMKTFKEFSDVSIKLAITGVVFNTLFVGLFAHFLLGYSIVYALLLASIISGTGAGVVLSFEKALSRYGKSFTILKMESILNSPLTIIFPILLLDLIALQPGAIIEPLKYASQLWQMVAVGVGAGFIVGFAVSRFLKRMVDEYTSLFIVAVSFVTYALAENVGGSGILAVAVCGLITGNLIFPDKQEVRHFDDQFSEMLRISIFTLFGAQIMLTFNIAQVQTVLILFLLLFFSRPVFVIPSVKKLGLSRREKIIMCFVAPRGTSEAAMAPIAAAALVAAGQQSIATDIINVIFMLVILSVVFSTGTAWFFSRSKGSNKVKIVPAAEPLTNFVKPKEAQEAEEKAEPEERPKKPRTERRR